MAIQTVNLGDVEKNTANIYEAVIIAARRARQINENEKLEFNTLLSTMIPAIEDDFEERGNPDQERISVEFEKREKSQLRALDELMEGKLEYRYRDKDEFSE